MAKKKGAQNRRAPANNPESLPPAPEMEPPLRKGQGKDLFDHVTKGKKDSRTTHDRASGGVLGGVLLAASADFDEQLAKGMMEDWENFSFIRK